MTQTIQPTATTQSSKLQSFFLFSDNANTSNKVLFDENFSLMDLDISSLYENLFKTQNESDSFQIMLASEKILSKDWDSPEEDEAWAHL